MYMALEPLSSSVSVRAPSILERKEVRRKTDGVESVHTNGSEAQTGAHDEIEIADSAQINCLQAQ